MFKRQELINTLNVLAIASLVLFYFFEREWILLITFAFLFGNLVLTPVHEWVAIGWLKFAHLLGMVNSKLLLSGIFFMVVTPLACLRRMLTNDLQASFFFKKEESYFTTVNRVYKHEDFEKTW